MADTTNPGDKKLGVTSKTTLTLKPRVETGTVRQSFPHGRTKQVVVEKRGKRRIGGEAPATETRACARARRRQGRARCTAKAPLGRPRGKRAAGRACARRLRRGAAHADRGRACRARQRAGRCPCARSRGTADRRRGSQAPRQPRRHRAGRARSRRSPPQGRRRSPSRRRRSQAQGRVRSQEALRRGRDDAPPPRRARARRPRARRQPSARRRPSAPQASPPSRTRTTVRARFAAVRAAQCAPWWRRNPLTGRGRRSSAAVSRSSPRSMPMRSASVRSPRSAAAPSA